jgi:hypothetical protein
MPASGPTSALSYGYGSEPALPPPPPPPPPPPKSNIGSLVGWGLAAAAIGAATWYVLSSSDKKADKKTDKGKHLPNKEKYPEPDEPEDEPEEDEE